MQTIVDRKVTSTNWTDNLKENDAEVHFHFEQNSLLNMRLANDRIPARNTLLYDNQQKPQMRLKNTFLSSSEGSGLIWIQTVLKLSTDGSNR